MNDLSLRENPKLNKYKNKHWTECINYVSNNFSDFAIIFSWFLGFPQNVLLLLLALCSVRHHLLLLLAKAVDLNRLGKKLPCRVNIFETENKTSAALPTVGWLCLFNFNYSRSRWSIWIFSWHYEKRKVKKSSSFGRVIVDVSICIAPHCFRLPQALKGTEFSHSPKKRRLWESFLTILTIFVFWYLCIIVAAAVYRFTN